MNSNQYKRNWRVNHDNTGASVIDYFAFISCFQYELELSCVLQPNPIAELFSDKYDSVQLCPGQGEDYAANFHFYGQELNCAPLYSKGFHYIFLNESPEQCFLAELPGIQDKYSGIKEDVSFHFSGWATRQISLAQRNIRISNTRISGRPRYDLLSQDEETWLERISSLGLQLENNMPADDFIMVEAGLFDQHELDLIKAETGLYVIEFIDLGNNCRTIDDFQMHLSNYFLLKRALAVIASQKSILAYDFTMFEKTAWFISKESSPVAFPELGFINKPENVILFAREVRATTNKLDNSLEVFKKSLFHNFKGMPSLTEDIIKETYNRLFKILIFGGVLK